MKKRGRKKQRAVSPVISTVLLILIVVIIAIIILLWARGFIRETILKEVQGESKRVDLYCNEVSLEPIVNDDGSFGFRNSGNIPIYAFKIKRVLKGVGSSEVIKIESKSGGLINPGMNVIINDVTTSGTSSDYEDVKIIPILLGRKDKAGLAEFECPEVNSIKIL